MSSSRSSRPMFLVVSDDHQYEVPKKCVKRPQDVVLWEKSQAYSEYVGFVIALNEVIKRKPLSVTCNISEHVQNILNILDKFSNTVDVVKPVEQPQRFGNQSFRTWHDIMKTEILDILLEVLPARCGKALTEVLGYFIDSFGNPTRIDYGTGHEMSFIMFLYCLFRIGVLMEDDKLAVVIRIFPKYLELVRKLQITYRMEPAGSHGVWSLDDYQFIPFIWGSAQLIDHPTISPSLFLSPDILQNYSKDFMFLTCIEYINKVKTGPFAEHSNQLWGISAVPSWSKVNAGLIKMYKAEVLSKFPVVQHIVFGSLLSFQPLSATTPPDLKQNVASTKKEALILQQNKEIK